MLDDQQIHRALTVLPEQESALKLVWLKAIALRKKVESEARMRIKANWTAERRHYVNDDLVAAVMADEKSFDCLMAEIAAEAEYERVHQESLNYRATTNISTHMVG